LKTLAEIVLVLASVYAILIAICAVAIANAARPATVSPGVSIGPTGFKSLPIALINGLSQQIGPAVVGVVPSPVSIYAITALCNVRIRIDRVIARADRSRSKLAVSLVPLGFSLLLGFCLFLLQFFLALLIVFVTVIVSLSARCYRRSKDREKRECNARDKCFKIDFFQDNPLSARFDIYDRRVFSVKSGVCKLM
jgi:hypothetical protein